MKNETVVGASTRWRWSIVSWKVEEMMRPTHVNRISKQFRRCPPPGLQGLVIWLARKRTSPILLTRCDLTFPLVNFFLNSF